MATDFKYATIEDLNKYFNRVSDFDSKVQIFPTLTSGSLHLFRDSGLVGTLFVNGEELAAAQSTSGDVDANGEWFYNSSTNQVEYYNSNYSSTTINEQVFEAGVDFTTFLNQSLVDASLELHNYIDARYSTPLEKQKQVDINTTIHTQSNPPVYEYDPIIIKSVCYIAAANLIRAKEGASEEADYYHSLVTNPERTGIIDKLNDGIYKLSHEVDSKDKNGKIRSMYEPVHGSAPDIAGKNIANPIATILSLSMALRYSLDLDKEAEQLDKAVQSVLDDGLRTKDIMSKNMKEVSTSVMGDAIIAKLK